VNRYLHQNEDINDGYRFSKEEFEEELLRIKEEKERELWLS